VKAYAQEKSLCFKKELVVMNITRGQIELNFEMNNGFGNKIRR